MALPFTHLTSTKQLTRAAADSILEVAKEMEAVVEKGGDDRLAGKILASLFFEPSTRTRLSFETAMSRLGGQVITASDYNTSSFKKGESIEDTIKTVSQYADIIAMRHPEQGSAEKAAAVSSIPFINAGDGPGQHPTQALLDLYTLQKEFGKIDGLNIAFVGDLRFSRTFHSLTFLLGLYDDITLTLVAPDELKAPPKITDFLNEKGISYTEETDLEAGLNADMLYMTRIQEERFTDRSEYLSLKDSYVISADHVKGKDIIVMDPLPRVGSTDESIDELPNAAYFRQVKNGVPVRMALLAMLLDAS